MDSDKNWIPIYPSDKSTLNQPTKIECIVSSSSPISYIMAYEQDGGIKDVTKKYCSCWNAKLDWKWNLYKILTHSTFNLSGVVIILDNKLDIYFIRLANVHGSSKC